MSRRRLLYACAYILAALTFAAMGMATRPPQQPVASTAAAALAQATSTPVAVHGLSGQTDTYLVQKVIDGDTIDIVIHGTTTRLRLIGMDTPETVDPRKPVQCFGKAASAKAHALLDGKQIRIESDSVAGTYDKYGRMLAYVFLADGTSYNEFMIREGYAHEYAYNNQNYKYRDEFRAAQKAAQAEQKGFWSQGTCGGNTTNAAG